MKTLISKMVFVALILGWSTFADAFAQGPDWRPLTNETKKSCSAKSPCRLRQKDGKEFDFIFKTHVDPDNKDMYFVEAVIVLNRKDGARQTFKIPSENGPIIGGIYNDEEAPIYAFDLLERGYSDVALFAFNVRSVGPHYYYFLYDPERQSFVMSEETFPFLELDRKKGRPFLSSDFIRFHIVSSDFRIAGSDAPFTWRKLTAGDKKSCTDQNPCAISQINGPRFEVRFKTQPVPDDAEHFTLDAVEITNLDTKESEIYPVGKLSGEWFESDAEMGLYVPDLREGVIDFALLSYYAQRRPYFLYFLYDEEREKFVLSDQPHPALQWENGGRLSDGEYAYEIDQDLKIQWKAEPESWQSVLAPGQKTCSQQTPCRVRTHDGTDFQITIQTNENLNNGANVSVEIVNLKTKTRSSYSLFNEFGFEGFRPLRFFIADIRPSQTDLALWSTSDLNYGYYHYFLYDPNRGRFVMTDNSIIIPPLRQDANDPSLFIGEKDKYRLKEDLTFEWIEGE